MPQLSNIIGVLALNYKNCCLYGLKSKRKLFQLLHIVDAKFMKQSFVVKNYKPFLNQGKRLVEAPSTKLKMYQTRLFHKLSRIDIPYNIFCGTKGKSYVDNAKIHVDNANMIKVDISKFYPSISRDKVYRFFKDKMEMPSDVAEILTNFATINLDMKDQNSENIKHINIFLNEKSIKTGNHLATGTPFGSLLSYLVNIDMYDELQSFADKNGLTMSAYIDDIAFSTNKKISNKMRKSIFNIIRKHHYVCNKSKNEYYGKRVHKRLTGVIITSSKKLNAQNKLLKEAKEISNALKKATFIKTDAPHSLGVLSAIEMCGRKMPNLKRELKKSMKSES